MTLTKTTGHFNPFFHERVGTHQEADTEDKSFSGILYRIDELYVKKGFHEMTPEIKLRIFSQDSSLIPSLICSSKSHLPRKKKRKPV